MSSLLTYDDQGFWVSNGINAVLYEVLVAMTCDDYPEIYQLLNTDEDLMMARYAGGIGFSLNDFERIFGGRERFKTIATSKWSVIDDVCGNDRCSMLVQRVFNWAFALMSGATCNYNLKPYAKWRSRLQTPVYCLSLGLLDLAPERSEYPSIHELPDSPFDIDSNSQGMPT